MTKIFRLAAYKRAWSHCGSVTLEGKQHSVVFLHSRAASLRALRLKCEPHSATQRVTEGGSNPLVPVPKKQKTTELCGLGCPFIWRRLRDSNPRGLWPNGFQDRLVVTASISLRKYLDMISHFFSVVKSKSDKRAKE